LGGWADGGGREREKERRKKRNDSKFPQKIGVSKYRMSWVLGDFGFPLRNAVYYPASTSGVRR